MSSVFSDLEYINIIKDILDSEEFNKIKEWEHHGITRFDHSLKVSYRAYRIAKTLKLDYVETARAGLLHDFFITDAFSNKDKLKSVFTHPVKAVENASENFSLSVKEKDIIVSHMWPFNLHVPKYAESWVVNMVDKVIGTYELLLQHQRELAAATNIYVIFLLGYVK